MNTRTLRLALIVGMVSALGITAAAATGKMAKLDLNSDAVIDKTEFLSGANQKFADMDTDSDGFVTQDERKAFKDLKREERAQRRFERKDANNDGVISLQEDQDARANRDQMRVTRRAERQAEREARGVDGDHRKNRDGKREGKRKRFNPDANDDGVIDVAENAAAAEHAFARMDKNGDGVLTEDELKRKKRRGKRKHRRSDR